MKKTTTTTAGVLCATALTVLSAVRPAHAALQSDQETDGEQGSTAEENPLQKQVDLYNYLTARVQVLKTGRGLAEVKAEIMNDLDFQQLDADGVNLLQSIVAVCDAGLAIEGKADAGSESKSEAEDLQEAAALTSAVLAGTNPLIILLSALGTDASSSANQESRRTLEHRKVLDAMREKLSSIDFSLAMLRGNLESKSIDKALFVYPKDYALHLSARQEADPKQKTVKIAKALAGSPKLQHAALDLATHYFHAGQFNLSRKYCMETIESSPSILRRDAIRAQAYYLLSEIDVKGTDWPSCLGRARTGLDDDGAHVGLLKNHAFALHGTGDHERALDAYEKLALLLPDDPTTTYNLGTCIAVVRKDWDEALRHVILALERGFTNIRHVREDPSLSGLRRNRKQQFEELVTLKIAAGIHWKIVNADTLLVRNDSKFPLVDLAVTATPVVRTTSGTPAKAKAVTFTVKWLEPGKTQDLGAIGYTTQTELLSLEVSATNEQGSFQHTYDIASLRQ